MRDFSKNEFFFMELSNCIIALVSWYIAISFYLEYQIMSYLIAISVVFSINFLILMILVFKSSYERDLSCIMKELLFLGFLNREIYSDSGCQDPMINYSSLKSIFQLIINIVLFFGVGLISDEQIKSYHVFLCYFLVLSQIIRYASLGFLYSLRYEELPKILKFNNSFVYIVTIFSMIMFNDNYGINLGYYQLILIGVCIVICIFIQNVKNKSDILNPLVFNIITNAPEQLDNFDEQFLLGLACGCQIVRLILLSVFGFNSLENINQSPIYYYEVIRELNLCIVLLVSLPYFIHNIYILLSYIKRIQFIEIRSIKDVLVLQAYVQKRHFFLQKLKIIGKADIIKSENPIMSINENVEPLIVNEQEQEQNIYLFYFQIFKSISDFQKVQKNVKVGVKCDIILFNDVYLIIGNIENLHKKLINQQTIQKYHKQIITQRFENGFLFNNSTQSVIRYLPYQEEKVCYQMISQTLSIQIFHKKLKNLMTFSPNQIIFDLYNQ